MPSYENAARKARPCIAPASLLALGARASRPRQAAEERMEQRMSGGNGHGHSPFASRAGRPRPQCWQAAHTLPLHSPCTHGAQRLGRCGILPSVAQGERKGLGGRRGWKPHPPDARPLFSPFAPAGCAPHLVTRHSSLVTCAPRAHRNFSLFTFRFSLASINLQPMKGPRK